MKRFILLLTLILCSHLALFAQKSKSNQDAPKEDIHVNREYDEKGNLIKFDSIHSYSWSSDTSLLQSISPEDFPIHLGDHFGFSPDSTFLGNSFFDDFDQFFASPFSSKSDSLFMQKLGLNHHFLGFEFNNDTLSRNDGNIDDLFNNFGMNKNDSISTNSQRQSAKQNHPRSMNEMMKMMQQQMKEMEEFQRKFFKE